MKNGFTLIEVSVATVLAVIVMAAGLLFLSNYVKLSHEIEKRSASLQLHAAVLTQITKDIQNSQGISPSSTATKMMLVYPTELLTYEYKNGKVKRKTMYLTDAGEISALSFKYDGKLVGIKLDSYTTKALCRN